MEVIIVSTVLFIVILLPFLLFSSINFFINLFVIKKEKISFWQIIKKTRLFSFLWVILAYGTIIVLYNVPDNLIIRTGVSIGLVCAFFGINYANLRKIIAGNAIAKNKFLSISIFYNLICIGFVGSVFYSFYPNKIIQINSVSEFNEKIKFLSSCNKELKIINETMLMEEGLIYAYYDETGDKMIFVKKGRGKESELFSGFSWTKISDNYLKTYYVSLLNEKIEKSEGVIDIDRIKPKKIGKSIIYAYSVDNPNFLIDLKTSYHAQKQLSLECPNFIDHHCNVDLFYDSKQNIFVLSEEIGSDGP